MKVFKKKNIIKNEDNTVFVGAFVPLQLNTYLTLRSLATGVSKSKLMSNALNMFSLEGTKNDKGLNSLIRLVADNAIETWKSEVNGNTAKNALFFISIGHQLAKKGVDKETANKIIKIVKDETEQQ